tara:strand:- start:810 stop:968 length:159 start_codon:yes stop_codon:yes gene_type:complete
MLKFRQTTHNLCDALLGQFASSACAVRVIEQAFFTAEHGVNLLSGSGGGGEK